MKNDELLLNIIFEKDKYELTLLIKKDDTLKSLLEALYYGFKKSDSIHFEMLKNYFRHHDALIIKYRSTENGDLIRLRKNSTQGYSCFDSRLDELGIVTTSQIVIPDINYEHTAKTVDISMPVLFDKKTDKNSSMVKFDSLRDQEKLEYNISTRRITTAEPSVIDIIPPENIPRKNKRSLADVIVPTLISMGALFAARALLAIFQDNASGFSMMAMMWTTSLATIVTQSYNYFKQGSDDKKNIEEWRTNYQEYLNNILVRIKQWQESDIAYLCTTYPDVQRLFENVSKLDRSIFSRSQNDADFMNIVLGKSGNVDPLFEIKNEKKDQIINNVRYKITEINNKPKVEILYYEDSTGTSKPKLRLLRKLRKDTGIKDMGDGALTDLAYDLATDRYRYLMGVKQPPLLLSLKNCGALGVVYSIYDKNAEYFVENIIFELSYYHTPEDIQFVIFFNKTDDEIQRMEKIKNYKNLPHMNELFGDASQFVFNKSSSAIAFEKLQAIMNERAKEMQNEDENEKTEKFTQIVCIVFDDYDIKETGFSKYLPSPPVEGEPYINKNGLTFIFVSQKLERLPQYCGNIIEFNSTENQNAELSNRYNVLSRVSLNKLSKFNNDKELVDNPAKLIESKSFSNQYVFRSPKDSNVKSLDDFEKNIGIDYENSFRRLSALYYRRIAENGNVPSMVKLLDMYDGFRIPDNRENYWNYLNILVGNWSIILEKEKKIQNIENEKSFKNHLKFVFGPKTSSNDVKDDRIFNMLLSGWYSNDVTKNLSVPIGANEHGPVFLDLHEKADGPHMLVAGTTGSGKSETIITYLIGLCMKYSPTDLNLMLVDMKGGGFSNRLRTLPHCVGVVDDTSGESEGISAVYMLKRFLEVLNAEIKYRKLQLNKLGVDNVDSYIRAQRIISKLLLEGPDEKLQKKLNEKQLEQLRKCKEHYRQTGKKSVPKPLSHLVLVVDEFTELKRFSSESNDIDFISEITTIARVGRTLGFHIILVSQNIEGAITEDIRVNSKSRICLKVATRAASKEMLDGRPDAASPTMPGNGRAYLLVGTGSKFLYFQSAYTGAHRDDKMEKSVEVTKINSYGNYELFYKSTDDNERIKNNSKNVNENDTQLIYIVKMIEAIDKGNKDESVFVRPRIIFQDPLKSVYHDETDWIGLV